jgi:hypothetical protein
MKAVELRDNHDGTWTARIYSHEFTGTEWECQNWLWSQAMFIGAKALGRSWPGLSEITEVTDEFYRSINEIIKSEDISEMLRLASSLCFFIKRKGDDMDLAVMRIYNAAMKILSTRHATKEEELCLAAFRVEAFKKIMRLPE